MSSLPRVLVTGAAGKSGRATVLTLTERYSNVVQTRAMVRRDDARAEELRAVRAFVRKLDHRSKALESAGAEIFVGNQYSITDMRKAMAGVKRAYQCAPAAPNLLLFNVTFTVAAYETELEHIVNLGQWLARRLRHPTFPRRLLPRSDNTPPNTDMAHLRLTP